MDKQIITNRVNSLRNEMKKHQIDAYLVPTNDFHSSEYVGDYFKTRAYISGFNGSAGTVLITLDKAILWADGRYFLQAESDVKDTPFELYKMGEPGVPTIYEYLHQNEDLKNIGFDGRCYPVRLVKMIEKQVSNREYHLNCDLDLVGDIWNDRPKMSCEKASDLSVEFSGLSRIEKLNNLKAWMQENHYDNYILTSLDDIAWLLNIRGADVECNPVVLSFVLISHDDVSFYCQPEALSQELKEEFNKCHINIKDYQAVYLDVQKLNKEENIYLHEGVVNYTLYNHIACEKKISGLNWTTEQKAIKNETEIKGAINAHIRDGVALTKFIYDMKKDASTKHYSELEASAILEKYRSEKEYYQGLSFDTIAGWAEHGAIIHYEPTKETDIKITDNNFLLVDSGGQYLDGTTDVTRTIAIGKVSDKQKYHYTLVLKSHLALGDAVFPRGYSGAHLDILAREPLFKEGLTYNHGTGHGVGSYLNVHEGPQNISGNFEYCKYPFKPGMITSNEPGLYFAGEYGIRTENLILCEEVSKDSKYLRFKTLTLAPYDVDAIDKKMLTKHEIELIHNYHERIYDELHEYLPKEVNKWLQNIIKAL